MSEERIPNDTEEDKKFEEMVRMIDKAVKIIKEKTGAEPDWEGWDESRDDQFGTIKCPECGKDLYYRVAGCNQHISGTCYTEGCLNWTI